MTAAVGPDAKLISSCDTLILEDEKARMVLRGTEKLINKVVTGDHLVNKTDALDILLHTKLRSVSVPQASIHILFKMIEFTSRSF